MKSISSISSQIWDQKYRLKDSYGRPKDHTLVETWDRVARALSQMEMSSDFYHKVFLDALQDFKFLPGGRIIAGAGSGRNVTLFNCYVMGTIPDDMSGIFSALREAALTMQQGGGIGYDFSTLRPKGALVHGVGADASGPLSFMDVWDAMCRTIMSAGTRRGAMMATLRCDHPDIEEFIEAKSNAKRLRMFNLSVLVTDAFMKAISADKSWELVFDKRVYKTVRARDLWNRMMKSTYQYAEPGVIFIDRINRRNNLAYCEKISATNPCGEQPLPPYGACLLGSLNLTRFIKHPFQVEAELDLTALEALVPVAVRMMDNAIDVSNFPLAEQEEEAKRKRRIGLGVTGLGDALIMCGARYGSKDAVRLTELWMNALRNTAYRASVKLAREKGSFPAFLETQYLSGECISELPYDIRDGIAKYGIRNSLLTSVAPTGTISLLANNISSGLEPVFAFKYNRTVLSPSGVKRTEAVEDYAYQLFRKLQGNKAELPPAFVNAQTLTPQDHVLMQAAVQKYVDSSISKTINCPKDISFEKFKDIYELAYDSGCKGCTTFRPNDITGAVLSLGEEAGSASQTFELNESAGPNDLVTGRVDANIVQMTTPIDRPSNLDGKTYKIKWPESDHAIYITLNDIIQNGKRRPFEIFINSKNMEHFAWTVALTRMISAVFRRGGDVSFVAEELKAVFDPRGGAWMKKRYVPSLLAAIGRVIEEHLISIGFLKNSETFEEKVGKKPSMHNQFTVGLGICPKCREENFLRQEGCDLCISCGYSKCG